MEQQNFTCSITANTTAQEAFKAISRVNEWWVKNVEGNSEKLNDVFTVDFTSPSFVTFRISEVVADKKIVWHVTDCYLPWFEDKKEWNNTDVVFELEEKGNATQVNFTHVGLVPEVECYDTCVKGWTQHFAGSLSKLLNEGVSIAA
jgi:hypothetical protein